MFNGLRATNANRKIHPGTARCPFAFLTSFFPVAITDLHFSKVLIEGSLGQQVRGTSSLEQFCLIVADVSGISHPSRERCHVALTHMYHCLLSEVR